MGTVLQRHRKSLTSIIAWASETGPDLSSRKPGKALVKSLMQSSDSLMSHEYDFSTVESAQYSVAVDGLWKELSNRFGGASYRLMTYLQFRCVQ